MLGESFTLLLCVHGAYLDDDERVLFVTSDVPVYAPDTKKKQILTP